MLQVIIPPIPEMEFFDEGSQTFLVSKEITSQSTTLQLEHSLVSLARWEAKWNKPFLVKDEKTLLQTIDYVRCMTITQNVNPDVYNHIPKHVFEQIKEYIDAPMTATWFTKSNDKPNREVVTAELIYYWMIAQSIPVEFQKWHLNRLLTLIRVCSIKNAPQKKMSAKEAAMQRRSMNAARRGQMNTKG